MPRIEEHVEIAASPADVFRFCHDPERRPEWDERVAAMRLLTPMSVRRGTLFCIDASHARKAVFSWEGEYVEFRFPSGSKARVIDAAPSSYFRAGSEAWRLELSNGGARFTLVWDYRPRGILGWVLDALGGRTSVRRAIRQSLTNLKEAIESGS